MWHLVSPLEDNSCVFQLSEGIVNAEQRNPVHIEIRVQKGTRQLMIAITLAEASGFELFLILKGRTSVYGCPQLTVSVCGTRERLYTSPPSEIPVLSEEVQAPFSPSEHEKVNFQGEFPKFSRQHGIKVVVVLGFNLTIQTTL